MDRFPTTSWDSDHPEIDALLAAATVCDTGLIGSASNYVFLLELQQTGMAPGYAIYKPLRGETPLWDFPPAFYKREVACYLVSEALGWRLVPPTVEREEGLEHGVGSLQLYIPSERRHSFFDLRDEHAEAMRRFATFDWLVNNADRKGGHLIQQADGHIWGIDNALTFHLEEKLRTVIWDYAGQPVAAAPLGDIGGLAERLQPESALWRRLAPFLEAEEITMLRQRAEAILEERRLPHPPSWRRPYPWPLI